MILRSFSFHMGLSHRRNHPDLRLEGPFGDGDETDEEHIINLHETFTDLPLVFALA